MRLCEIAGLSALFVLLPLLAKEARGQSPRQEFCGAAPGHRTPGIPYSRGRAPVRRFNAPVYAIPQLTMPYYQPYAIRNSYQSYSVPDYRSTTRSIADAQAAEEENALRMSRIEARQEADAQRRAKKRAAVKAKEYSEEERAEIRLRLANQLIQSGRAETGRKWLALVVETYPNSAAAEMARELLAASSK